jgi:hypothetical protein
MNAMVFSAMICVHFDPRISAEKMHFPADVRRLKDTLICADEMQCSFLRLSACILICAYLRKKCIHPLMFAD